MRQNQEQSRQHQGKKAKRRTLQQMAQVEEPQQQIMSQNQHFTLTQFLDKVIQNHMKRRSEIIQAQQQIADAKSTTKKAETKINEKKQRIIDQIQQFQRLEYKQMQKNQSSADIKQKDFIQKKEKLYNTDMSRQLVMEIFYQKKNYANKGIYIQMMRLFSKRISYSKEGVPEQVWIKNRIYILGLKRQFLEIYKNSIKIADNLTKLTDVYQVLNKLFFEDLPGGYFMTQAKNFSEADQNQCEQSPKNKPKIFRRNMKNKSSKFFEKETLLLLFRFPNDEVQQQFRRFFLRQCFHEAISNYQLQKNRKYTQEEKLTKFFPGGFSQLAILTAKPSFAVHDVKLKARLEQMVQIIKTSWFIRVNLSKFFQGRERMLRILNNEDNIEITDIQKIISDELLDIQVFFIDFADDNQCGITLTNDAKERYPIFINMFQFYDSKSNYSQQKILTYSMFVLLHQLAHSLIRRLKIIQRSNISFHEKDQSNGQFQDKLVLRIIKYMNKKKNIFQPQKFDGGWLLQKFLFGDRIKYFFDEDYETVKPLLMYKQNPNQHKKWNLFQNWEKVKAFCLKLKTQKNLKQNIKEKNNLCHNQVKPKKKNEIKKNKKLIKSNQQQEKNKKKNQKSQQSKSQIRKAQKKIQVLSQQISALKSRLNLENSIQQSYLHECSIYKKFLENQNNNQQNQYEYKQQKNYSQYSEEQKIEKLIEFFSTFGQGDRKDLRNFQRSGRPFGKMRNSEPQVGVIGRCGVYRISKVQESDAYQSSDEYE